MTDQQTLPERPEHEHEWTMDPDGTGVFVTIDTYPPLTTFWCKGCDAVTHQPDQTPPPLCTIGHFR